MTAPAVDVGSSASALLVVDLAASAVADLEQGKIAGGPSILANCRELVAGARSAGVPVIMTAGGMRWHTSPGSGLPAGVRGSWVWFHGLRGDTDPEQARRHHEFSEAFAPEPDDVVIVKHRPSAFFGTALVSFLNALRCDELVIAGVMTSGCVRASVTDAFSYDLRPVLVTDAVGDVNPSWHAHGLEELQAKYCRGMTTAEVTAGFAASR